MREKPQIVVVSVGEPGPEKAVETWLWLAGLRSTLVSSYPVRR